jgi:hypothetical protein
MIVAIDYDDTFTRDPVLWASFIGAATRRGHKVICVTGRYTPPEMGEPPLPPGVPVICTAGELKHPAALRAGYCVDVWIDDMPGLIKGSQMLEGLTE